MAVSNKQCSFIASILLYEMFETKRKMIIRFYNRQMYFATDKVSTEIVNCINTEVGKQVEVYILLNQHESKVARK